jgi:hypothetical protein
VLCVAQLFDRHALALPIGVCLVPRPLGVAKAIQILSGKTDAECG